MAKKETTIALTKQESEACIEALRVYFIKERGEEMGHLAGEILLRYILKEIGPVLYNHGVSDAATFVMQRVGDLVEIEK